MSREELRHEFMTLAADGAAADLPVMIDVAGMLADLLRAAELIDEDPTATERCEQIVQFCREEALPVFRDPHPGSPEIQLECLRTKIRDCWDSELALLTPEERFQCPTGDQWPESWREAGTTVDSDSDLTDSVPSSSVDLAGIMATLLESGEQGSPPAAEADESSQSPTSEKIVMPEPPSGLESIDDPEIVAAYVDDAQQCLGEMEACLLTEDAGQLSAERLTHFCRQLHTLKGASGTVGLSELAHYLHDLESYIEAAGPQVDADRLLEGVDAVRRQLRAVESQNPLDSSAESAEHPTASELPAVGGTGSEMFVRVEASRLERLMDLLAELVMLRNRRETHVESLRTVHQELSHFTTRTRNLTSVSDLSPRLKIGGMRQGDHRRSDQSAVRSPAGAGLISKSLHELAEDTAEITRSLQQILDPLSDQNSTVSHLIGRFRQELMELRRQPCSGLFQRLHRAVREAAKSEGKQITLSVEGQGARAERALQERLYEPLLHLVRNAVSHGIESQDERVRSGKTAAGMITLRASSDATGFCIEVADDGRGLNEEALEKRGRDLGLLQPGEHVTQARLWNLIFQPGFSTRDSVSGISGRGVGMDVVASWIRRLRGRIEVESVRSRGTVIRLRIPLRSGIEHAMVVRAGGQLFALPMHMVEGTSDSRMSIRGVSPGESGDVRSLQELLTGAEDNGSDMCRISLRHPSNDGDSGNGNAEERLTISVDAVVGVDEVVVRSLPPLCQRNELFAGVTLSVSAETVLILDVGRLIERARQPQKLLDHSKPGQHTRSTVPERRTILVVDDSLVIRKSLTRKFRAAGYNVMEASGGQGALKILKQESVAGVVTDIDMPGMSGTELLQEVRRSDRLRHLPVCVLSSRAPETIRTMTERFEPAAIHGKPVTDKVVQEIIESLRGEATAELQPAH